MIPLSLFVSLIARILENSFKMRQESPIIGKKRLRLLVTDGTSDAKRPFRQKYDICRWIPDFLENPLIENQSSFAAITI
jgi:hypothetical protein